MLFKLKFNEKIAESWISNLNVLIFIPRGKENTLILFPEIEQVATKFPWLLIAILRIALLWHFIIFIISNC